jgi:hypothetical protein
MMTPAPDSDEAQQALHAVRQQQANLIRRNLAPLPAWGWLAGAALLVLDGLIWDLRGPARWAVAAVVVAALIAGTRVYRRRAGAGVRSAWWHQQFDNRTFWIFALYIAVVVIVQQQMALVFTRTGLAWPNTLGGCAAAAVLLVAGPPVRAVLRRRLIAHAESGSDDRLHGLPRVLSLLPAYEARERHQRERAGAARRRAGGTGPDTP